MTASNRCPHFETINLLVILLALSCTNTAVDSLLLPSLKTKSPIIGEFYDIIIFVFRLRCHSLLRKGSKMDVYKYKHYQFVYVQWHLFIIFWFYSIKACINRCRMDWNREEYTWDFKVCIHLVSLMHGMGMYLLCSHFPWCSQWYLHMHYIVDKVRNKYDDVRGISASLGKLLRYAYG